MKIDLCEKHKVLLECQPILPFLSENNVQVHSDDNIQAYMNGLMRPNLGTCVFTIRWPSRVSRYLHVLDGQSYPPTSSAGYIYMNRGENRETGREQVPTGELLGL